MGRREAQLEFADLLRSVFVIHLKDQNNLRSEEEKLISNQFISFLKQIRMQRRCLIRSLDSEEYQEN
jgi:hypothetical protein